MLKKTRAVHLTSFHLRLISEVHGINLWNIIIASNQRFLKFYVKFEEQLILSCKYTSKISCCERRKIFIVCLTIFCHSSGQLTAELLYLYFTKFWRNKSLKLPKHLSN